MQRSALPRPLYRLRRSHTLSRHAQRRLQWFDFYHAHGQNARLTCRHFAISSRTFYKWLHRFNLKDISCLEDRSRRPHRVRSSPLAQAERLRRAISPHRRRGVLSPPRPRAGKRHGAQPQTACVGAHVQHRPPPRLPRLFDSRRLPRYPSPRRPQTPSQGVYHVLNLYTS